MLPQRFWDKVQKTETCWYWIGAITAGGYPKYRTYQHVDTAYRVLYVDVYGEVPDGLHLDHLCHTRDLTCRAGVKCLHRRCVNPDHLEPVDSAENLRRAHRDQPDFCKNGHERTPENTVVRARSNGLMARDCRICSRAANARTKAKVRERRAAARIAPGPEH